MEEKRTLFWLLALFCCFVNNKVLKNKTPLFVSGVLAIIPFVF